MSKHADVAKRVLAHEAGGTDTTARAAGNVYAALFGALAPILGAAGVRALFARSVKLTTPHQPHLGEALPPPSDPLDDGRRLADGLSDLDAAAASEVAVALYASFFGLMTRFIGARMVAQIVKSAFPAVDVAALEEEE